MDMQDKDIDALFSNKLKHLEVEPSAKVWKGIVLELDGVKHKSKILPMIRVAASVILFISVGLFFLLKGDKTPVYTANNTGPKQKPIKELIDDAGNKTVIIEVQTPEKKEALQVTESNPPLYSAKTVSAPGTSGPVNTAQSKSEIINDQPVLAAAENTTLAHPTVPDMQLVAEHDITANEKFISAVNTEEPDLLQVKQKSRKHGIRTLGDLINVVVAKVDKREDKVIEFSNTADDDGSIVSGVNLGIIRIKKDK